MKWNILLLFYYFNLIQSATVTEFKKWSEQVQNSAFLCKSLPDIDGDLKLYEVVDCDERSAISAYDFKVKKLKLF